MSREGSVTFRAGNRRFIGLTLVARKVGRAAAEEGCHRLGRCGFPTGHRAAPDRRRLLAWSLFALLAGAACRPAKDPIVAAVDALVEAANKKDRSAIVQRLAPDFQAADGSNAADVDQRLRQIFAAYDSVDVSVAGLSVDHGNDVALARFRLEMTGAPSHFGGLDSFLPRSSRWKIELRLVPEGGTWRVGWARWEEEDR